MDFNHRNLDGAQCISDGDRSVSVRSRINQNSAAVFPGILDPVNQLAFVVALQKLNLHPVLRPKLPARLLDLRQRRSPVNLGFTGTKQIQIRTIQDIDCLHTNALTNLTVYAEDHKDHQDKKQSNQ